MDLLPGLEPATTLYDFEVGGATVEVALVGEHRNAQRKATLEAGFRARKLGLQGRLTLRGTRAVGTPSPAR